MRHRMSGRQLNRNSSNRKALFRSLAIALVSSKDGLIKTTLPKAKELRRVVEPLITLAKVDSVANRRLAYARLDDKSAVGRLFQIAPLFANRAGGYTRILRTGNRLGDNAEMCMMELVDYNENMLAAKETKKKVRRSRKKAADTTAEAAPAQEEKKEE